VTVDAGRVAALRDEGLSVRQIARKLGTSKSTVSRLLGTARRDSAGTAFSTPRSGTPGTPVGACTASDIRAGLTAVAGAAGNVSKASKWLSDAGHPIPEGTLREWRDRLHRDAYLQVRQELEPKLKEAQAIAAEDVAAQAAAVSYQALERLSRELPSVKTERLAGIAKDAQVAFGISSEKSAFWRDRPERIVEHRRDLPDILAEIHERAPGLLVGSGFAVDSTAAEEPEPDEPPELPPAA
jgi:helix-turn-helix protein